MAAPEHTAPIPAHVVTGPLGVGKTTVIARLLSEKPVAENWVVLLNEFSLAGIDALTVASAARGAYDVRLVPGGCLCCAGEDDFRRNLRQLVNEVRPDRILVEPAGIGHPAGIIEELLGYQASGKLQLEGVVALIDPARVAAALDESDELLRDHLDIADAVALSKADAADARQRDDFATLVGRAASVPRWSGMIEAGALPMAALQAGLPANPDVSRRPRAAEPNIHPGHCGAHWSFPRSVAFDEQRALAAVRNGIGSRRPVRLKAVLRVGDDRWLLLQHHGAAVSTRAISWRRDSRIEVLYTAECAADWPAWDALWSGCQVTGT
jgi:G3E family GTPase